MRTSFRHNQQGDTLVEVIIATVIIGMVLFSAFTLSNQAYKLGQSAKERTQATQLLQTQAEGIRALRDNASNWTSFINQIKTVGSPMHIEKSGSQWKAVSGGDWNPGQADSNLPGFYKITATYTQPSSDRLWLTLKIRWDRLGNGPPEESTIYYRLTDRAISVPAN